MDLPGVPRQLIALLVASAGSSRIALVGGAVRDLLLHRVHNDPWRGLPDLDLVVEGDGTPEPAAPQLARRLAHRLPSPVVSWKLHGAYGTVEMVLQLPQSPEADPPPASGPPVTAGHLPPAGDGSAGADEPDGLILLDVATARRESYPVAGENPLVSFGRLEQDLARRDFSVNAMALLLAGPVLLDPHGGQRDLAERRLRFLHDASVRDDPTRLLRAARYAARLGFSLAEESQDQARQTLANWPWAWRSGDPPAEAPAALGTRLRMELQLLLEREPWPQALEALQAWQGLLLLDPALQADRTWRRRLRWADRLGVPLIVALTAAAGDHLALAERLQLPQRQHHLLEGFLALRQLIRREGPKATGSPSRWSALLERPTIPPLAVALAVAAGEGPRRPLLRWWFRWRHLRSPVRATDLISQGVVPGPALGERLRNLRNARLEQERC
jgi:poly(A) polymerase